MKCDPPCPSPFPYKVYWIPDGWRDQRKQIEEKKTQKEVFEEGVQIGSNLKLLAERRTDIFGMEETVIGQKIGEEFRAKPVPTVQWDGHSGRYCWLSSLCS